MQDFNGKVAVITGGASGVGRSLAFALGRRGAKIAVGDVDKTAMAAGTRRIWPLKISRPLSSFVMSRHCKA